MSSNLCLYDHKLSSKGIIDTYESLLWNERYNDIGDFEIVIPIDASISSNIKIGDYVEILEHRYDYYGYRNIMMIDYINVVDNSDTRHLVIKGHDLSFLLKKRAILADWEIPAKYTYMTIISNIITKCVGAIDDYFLMEIGLKASNYGKSFGLHIPVMIPNYWSAHQIDLNGASLTEKPGSKSIIIQSGTVFDAIKNICDVCHWGFKLSFTKENELQLLIYAGRFHDGSKPNESLLVFSKDLDNLVSSDYTINAQDYNNINILLNDKYEATEFDGVAYYENLDKPDKEKTKKQVFKKYQKVSRWGRLFESKYDDNDEPPSTSSDKWTRIPWQSAAVIASGKYLGGIAGTEGLDPINAYYTIKKVSVKDYYGDDKEADDRIYVSHQEMTQKILDETGIFNKVQDYKKEYKPEIHVSGKYSYGKNYALGDTITYVDTFAGVYRGRIIEFTRVFDDQGYREFPVINIE